MRNLCIQAVRSRGALLNHGEQVLHFCVNSAEQLVYVATSQHRVLCLQPDGKSPWQVQLISASAPSERESSISSFCYVMDLEALCVAFSCGAMKLLHLGDMELEEVGLVQGGVRALEWSPDGETFALITGLGNLLTMNKDWELLDEVPLPLSSSELSSVSGPDPVASIAWRGDAKVLATNVLEDGKRLIHVWEREGCRLESTAADVAGVSGCMSWQPNGRHLYVAGVGEQGSQRVELFERNGLAHGGFDVIGAGRVSGLSWSSDSELLAVIRAPEDTERGADATWSVQVWHRFCWHWFLKYEQQFPPSVGRLLASWDDASPSLLHLVTATGSHTSLHFYWATTTTAKGTIAVVDGHDLMLTPLRRMMVPPPGCAVRGRLPAAVAALALTSTPTGEVGVVWMADARLALFRSPRDDVWEDADKYSDPSPMPMSKTNPGKSAEIHISPHILPPYRSLLHPLIANRTIKALAWLSPDTLLAVASCKLRESAQGEDESLEASAAGARGKAASMGDLLVEIQLDVEGAELVGVTGVPADEAFTHAVSRPGGGALLQVSDGAVYTYSLGGKLQLLPKPAHFPSGCSVVLAVPPVDNAQTQAPLLGLTSAGTLYLGSNNLAVDCNSVSIRSEGPGGPALLYTTRRHQLHVRFFADLLKDPTGQNRGAQPQPGKTIFRSQLQQRSAFSAAMRPAGADEASHDILQRSVEQGSSILAAPANTVRVVLIMPRGNLEGIAPRGLLLVALAEALREKRFYEAWQAATTHRVDLNFLVDYMWPTFLDHTEEVVTALKDPADLCDLLHALQPKSVVEQGGIYYPLPGPACPPIKEVAAGELEGGKVTAVCRAVREAVEALDPKGYLLVRVTSFARSDPADLASALKCVAEAKESALSQGNADDSLAEKAVRHLLLTVDVETLQKAALGMYDLALAYMVAVQGGKDPGEQLLQLQEFEAEQNLHLRQYKIDLYLKRYSAAIKNLMEAGPEEHVSKALSLAKSHGLMRELMQLCPVESGAHLQVLEAWAEQLQAADKLEDAALALLAAGRVDKAIGAYKSAGQWRMALALAGQQGYTAQKLQELAQEVVEQLHAWGDHMGMAAVLEQYVGDVDNAVSALTTAREWREALRVSQRHGRSDLVETVVTVSAAEAASTILQEAQDNADKINKYLQRLQDVQRKRAALQDALQDEGDKPEMDEDLHTEAMSTVAGLSIYTDATHTHASTTSSTRTPSTVGGRKPLRHMRKNKKGKVRPGTAQEEAMLVQHIKDLGPSDAMLTQVGQLTELLVLLSHRDDATKLQSKVALWLSTHQAAVKELDEAAKAAEVAAAATSGAAGPKPAPAQAPQPASKDKAAPSQAQWKWEILRAV